MRAVRAVVGSGLDYSFVSLGIVVYVFLAKRGNVEKAVQQVGTPVEQAGVFPDVIASCAERGEWTALKEGGRTNDCLLSCVVTTPVTGPGCIKKLVLSRRYYWESSAILTGHILAVSVGIVAAEEGVFFVAVHDRIESADDLGSRSTSEVLAVELAATSPAVDMVFRMLGKLYSIVKALTELMCLRGVAAGVDSELGNGSSIPWLLFRDLKGSLSSFDERCRSC